MKRFLVIALCALLFLFFVLPIINTFAKAVIAAIVIYIAYQFYKSRSGNDG